MWMNFFHEVRPNILDLVDDDDEFTVEKMIIWKILIHSWTHAHRRLFYVSFSTHEHLRTECGFLTTMFCIFSKNLEN